MKKYTEETSIIMHEIGHFIFFTLWLSSKGSFNKSMFCNNILRLSIVPNEEEKSFGHLTIGDPRVLKRNKLCRYFLLLSGVLCDILLVEHIWKIKFKTVRDIRNHFVDIYRDHGGSSDLFNLVLMDTYSATYDSIPAHIYELRKQIYKLWDQEVIRSITRKIYRKLQKDKKIYSEGCYKIIEPYIPELKKLGKQVYGPKTKLSVYAKTILF